MCAAQLIVPGVFAIAALAACSQPPETPPTLTSPPLPATSVDRSGPPTLDELRHATYEGFEHPAASVTLVDGVWEGAPLVEGGASRTRVVLADFSRTGDLDGDGADETVVLLSQSSGGSGTFDYLAVMSRRGGVVVNLGTALVGNRVQVREARIDGGQIALDVIQAGPADAMCCPTQLATRTWRLTGTTVEELPAAVTGTRSLEVMAGPEWVLRTWTLADPAPDEPRVTLQLQDGRFAGLAGCNRYTAGVTAGASPGDLVVSPGAGTRMMCPEPVMAVEDRFLRQLARVGHYAFLAGRLALSYEIDGERQTMLFARAEP